LIDHDHYKTLTDPHYSSTTETVWGAAYHIPASHATEVTAYLDIREQNGYSVQYTPFHAVGHSEIQTLNQCLVYIGLPSNPQFIGPQDAQTLAEHILKSKGPSGDNVEYLFMLEEALAELCPANASVESIDFHVEDLARRCRELMAEKGGNHSMD
jgi:glutathione-specific gamma-glutamylcyclotransferase